MSAERFTVSLWALRIEVIRSIASCAGYEPGWRVFVRYIAKETALPPIIVASLCRDLRNLGFLEFGQCFNEEGYTAGSGYGLTPKGEALHRASTDEPLVAWLATAEEMARSRSRVA